jgi:hypothetical protein
VHHLHGSVPKGLYGPGIGYSRHDVSIRAAASHVDAAQLLRVHGVTGGIDAEDTGLRGSSVGLLGLALAFMEFAPKGKRFSVVHRRLHCGLWALHDLLVKESLHNE